MSLDFHMLPKTALPLFLSNIRRIAALLILTSVSLVAQTKRAITPADCVQVRYLPSEDPYRSSIAISPKGDWVAYLLKEPNLLTNRNDISVMARKLSASPHVTSIRLAAGPDISQLTWLHSGTDLAFLAPFQGYVAIMKANVATGRVVPLFVARQDIREYTVDWAKDVIAYATDDSMEATGRLTRSPEEIASGYRIPYPETTNTARKKRRIFIVRRQRSGRWGEPKPVAVRSPFSNDLRESLPYLFHFSLSLSPDGRRVAITYPESTAALPSSWREDPTIHALSGMVQELYVMVLYDPLTSQTSYPFQSPMVYSIPAWQRDGHTLIVNADPPIESKWHREELGKNVFFTPHMFSVNVDTGETLELLSHVVNMYEGPLMLNDAGEAVVRKSRDTVARLVQHAAGWEEESHFRIPVDSLYRFAQIASDGVYVIGDSQATSRPPSLFLYRVGDISVTVLETLNPQFDHLTLAPVKTISWTTSTGATIQGLLFEPPNYQAEQTYPLVIHTKLEVGQFLCDTGDSHYPSFAPQPIANAGMMYVIRSWPEEKRPGDDVAFYPKGYPGGLGEAAFQMDIWESAVRSLAAKGMVDPRRVGIIGFSRTGWYTEFILEHSSLAFRAATITDNVTYSLGAYWLLRNPAANRVAESIYGGPPYGSSLSNWQMYSSTFNANKVKTPILMEEMGYGQPYDNINAPPLGLAIHFELFTALNRLHRPVEMYYYPNEEHQPNHPKARLATLQRNLDWYRFWLQGYERTDPATVMQYARWREWKDANPFLPHQR
ncbi:prolyl oligopeptidase family serine peptidase [Edaphobacter sp. HDX4]|uniref:prolyl oligopeptidase family serine peptidase n=1 Tax=Edaphobacter sp. HDX4 TaxID=2794064 RepID=UPI002FE60377